MGEKQIRAAAARAAAQALERRSTAVQDLAVAASAAGQADHLRAEAERRIEEIRAATEAEIARRVEQWRKAWQAALAAGWKPGELRGAPLNLTSPPAAKGRRRRQPSRAANREITARDEGASISALDASGPAAGLH